LNQLHAVSSQGEIGHGPRRIFRGVSGRSGGKGGRAPRLGSGRFLPEKIREWKHNSPQQGILLRGFFQGHFCIGETKTHGKLSEKHRERRGTGVQDVP